MLMLMVMLMLIMNQLCYQRGSSTEEQLTNMNCECVVGQNKIQVKMILTQFGSEFPLSSKPNYS